MDFYGTDVLIHLDGWLASKVTKKLLNFTKDKTMPSANMLLLRL
jgi:hypothetical protein